MKEISQSRQNWCRSLAILTSPRMYRAAPNLTCEYNAQLSRVAANVYKTRVASSAVMISCQLNLILICWLGTLSAYKNWPSEASAILYILPELAWESLMMTSSNGNISALLALYHHYEENPLVTGGFPLQRPVTRSFDMFFDLRLKKGLSKQSIRWWFETPSRSLWRHWNVMDTTYCVGPVSASI